MRLCLVLLFLWTTVHGTFDAASYTNYLMTAPIEDVLEANRPPRPGETTHVTVGALAIYEVVISGPVTPTEGEEPEVEVEVNQGGESIYKAKTAVSKLSPVSLDNGIYLFTDTPDGGWAFLYLEDAPRIELNNSDLAYLPEVPGKTVTAPVVISGGSVEISQSYIHHNFHPTKAGGVYVSGEASVNVNGGQIAYNKAEVGALFVAGSSVVELEGVGVFKNEGSITGAVYTNGESAFIGRKISFENQTTGSFATGVFSSGQSSSILIQCEFKGRPISEDYRRCLLDPTNNDTGSCSNDQGVTSGVLNVDDVALMTVIGSLLANHATVRGTVLSSGYSQLNVRHSKFTGNVANTGGGLFIENGRGGTATVLNCDFHDNVARFGGAMVLGGNGSSTIYGCTFTRNQAILGGAVWGNKTQNHASTTEGGGKASSVARVTVVLSDFFDNIAVSHGGALFTKWADIRSNLSTFYNNSAGGSGGAIYADDGYNLVFLDSQFDSNSANVSGGAVFALNANDITATNTTFTNHSALEHGGAIASVDGAGVVLRNTTISNGLAYGSGGAIYTDNVERIDVYKSELVGNAAGESGGALSLGKSSSLELDSVVLSPNIAYGKGGAIHASEGKSAIIKNIDISAVNSSSSVISLASMGTVELSGFHFEGYKHKKRCGGLEVDGASSLAITGMRFVGNEVDQHGGALCLAGIDSGEFSDLEFSDNVAGIAGGAIHITNSGVLNFRDIKFNKNFATHQGGAIRGANVASLNLIGDVFTLNTAEWKGGAVYLEGSSIDIQNSNFTHNYAGTKFEAFEKRTSVSNSPQSQSASGVVHVRDGGTFKSHDSFYEYNEAEAYGGMLALVGMQNVDIQYDHYLNGSASKSGGCILASGVLNLSIWDTTLKYCKAASGGALMVEGHSNIEGGYLFMEDNKADTGGAFLCRGASEVNLEATNFSLNSAEEGSTASIDCRCDINFKTSAFYRDKDLPNNGDFFHVAKGCGQINSEDCEFFGGKDHGNSIPWIWIVLCGVSLSGIVILVVIIRRRKDDKKTTEDDLEAGTKDEPLIHGKGGKKGRYQTTTLSTSDSEEYSTSETESSQDYSSYEESEEDSTEESEESDHKPRRAAKKTPKNPVQEVILLEDPTPIGKRTHSMQKAAAERRRASKDKVNEGAGPSSSHTPVVPSDMDPVTPDVDPVTPESDHEEEKEEKEE